MEETQSLQFDNDPTAKELQIGSMKIAKPQFKALLIFTKEDAQLQILEKCLGKLGFEYDVKSYDAALDTFLKKQPHLVIIDCRHTFAFDAETICSSLRNTHAGSSTTIVALVHRRNQISQASNTTDLLNAGFNRFIHETTKLDEIED
uniref:PDE8-like REC N-terminal domain-containing protein n=1 Tax=Ciona savignyi TaxID=51511 RepID=H2ZJ63_CIOSA